VIARRPAECARCLQRCQPRIDGLRAIPGSDAGAAPWTRGAA
jgi:hypothetical protein